MKQLITMGILSGILSLFGCGNNSVKKEKSGQQVQQVEQVQKAYQIDITQLSEQLALLEQNKTEFDFIGITSNGTDCIYFVRDNGKFQIEFEAMTESQIPFIEKLKSFADQNGYGTRMTTYGNKPQYNEMEAPVIRITSNSNPETTAEIGRKIQCDVFNNKADTKYEVVP